MKRKLLITILKGLSFLAVILLFGFVNNKRLATPCSEVDVIISGDTSAHFVESEDILQLLTDKGIGFKDVSESSVNLMEIEAIVKQHPAVESANVYSQADGKITIDVVQRVPIIRIIDALGESYYIDQLGAFMPLLPNYSARIPVATGSIFDSNHRLNTSVSRLIANDSAAAISVIDDLFLIIEQIRKDTFLLAQTEQLFVLPNKEIELIPRFGPQTILIGDATQLEDKLSRLKLFFTKGLPLVGWNAYSTVNLKYKNQLICTKNIQ
jgi:cell division protein FtsQ